MMGRRGLGILAAAILWAAAPAAASATAPDELRAELSRLAALESGALQAQVDELAAANRWQDILDLLYAYTFTDEDLRWSMMTQAERARELHMQEAQVNQ